MGACDCGRTSEAGLTTRSLASFVVQCSRCHPYSLIVSTLFSPLRFSQVERPLTASLLQHSSVLTTLVCIFSRASGYIQVMASWLPSVPYPPSRDGYWSPVTSTLNWCEEVCHSYYQVSKISNLTKLRTTMLQYTRPR